MDDYISRSAVCEALNSEGYTKNMRVHKKVLKIPAADVVERKKGKWKLHNDGSATCSECGFVQLCAWDMDSWDNFCHHCGADMREV